MNADLAGARAPILAGPTAPSCRGFPTTRTGASSFRSAVALAVVCALAFVAPPLSGVANAQSEDSGAREMTLEELERHVAEQKAALEQVRENRDITAEKAREVREALAEREAKRLEAEARFEALCREREAIEPGSYEDCARDIGG